MNVENLNSSTALSTGNAAVIETADLGGNEDAALEAVWNQIERDNGSARDEGGKFSNGNGEGDEAAKAAETDPNAPPQEGEGTGEEGNEAGSSTLTATGVPLPANWNGMDGDWAKIPPDVQAKIAARDTEIHARMSEQGRKISEFQPYTEVFDRNKDLLSGKKMENGSEPSMVQAVDFLMNAQRRLDQNPIAGLMEIAERYGVLPHLKAVFSGQMQIPSDPQPAGISPADVERIVKGALTEDATVKAANDELSRLTADKPLFSEIPEDDMVHFIHRARTKLGDAASKEAVFNQAYDMAVNADPDLRAKAAATKKAAAADPKRTADAKRANSVNVTSTSTGKARELTEDELLSSVYDEIQNKD
ncbi:MULTISPECIES: hypothetical protein [unclassified Mesorhizobium]|uniref:hypothetical protein n=1 Tax=unclassified Mesorhizobium TaxID=325217 RepID=UPI00301481AA